MSTESTPQELSQTVQAVQNPDAKPSSDTVSLSDTAIENSSPFVGKWNQLVSTTNWEKGRIIADWRQALIKSNAAITEYSDEAWSQLVGQVTGQHVGRLRRVHERFAAVREQFAGLFWSHFQAALDWQDSEMWLEGAITNKWSVSKMRAARWEAVGAPDGVRPSDDEVVHSELDEESYQSISDGVNAATNSDSSDKPTLSEVASPETHRETALTEETGQTHDSEISIESENKEPVERVRPFEELAELPDDIAEAFEQMKLAILTHKLAGWEDFSRDNMLAALDSLKEMALAPSDS